MSPEHEAAADRELAPILDVMRRFERMYGCRFVIDAEKLAKFRAASHRFVPATPPQPSAAESETQPDDGEDDGDPRTPAYGVAP